MFKVVLSYTRVLIVRILSYLFLHSELDLLVLIQGQGKRITLNVVLAVVGVWSFSKQHLLEVSFSLTQAKGIILSVVTFIVWGHNLSHLNRVLMVF